MNGYDKLVKLAAKAKAEWNENWNTGMMEYDPDENMITVWVGRADVYKAFFDADTLECLGTKC